MEHCNHPGNCVTTGSDIGEHGDLLEAFPYEIPVTIVEILMTIVILIGNGLVIVAYILDRKLRTVSNFFLVNLVIADFIVGLTIPISFSIYFIRPASRSRWLCIMQVSVIAIPLGSSTLCLLLITVERYLSVVYPFHHLQIFTKARRYTLVAISWILAIIIMGVIPFALPMAGPFDAMQKTHCDMMRLIPVQYWSYIVLPFTYLVFGSVIIVYMKILSVARHQIKSIELLVVQVSDSDKKSIQNVRLARTGFILLGLFLLCWLPFTILLTITVFGKFQDNQIVTIIRIASMVLAPASSAINPMIYAARIRRFKIRIKKLLHLTISNSDKYDTYEIRQSFRVKRTAAVSPIKKAADPVCSFDSGVSCSNDDNPENICTDPSIAYDQLRQSRALSRISESPESNHSPPIQIQLDSEQIPNSRKLSMGYTAQRNQNGRCEPTVSGQLQRKVKPSGQFLNIPNTTSDVNYLNKTSYTEESASRSSVCSNIESPCMRIKKSGRGDGRPISLTHRNSTSAICAEPIVIDCDNKSEYIRLVVRRTVRDCSDSESEDDKRDTMANTNSLSRNLKLSKRRLKNKTKSLSSDGTESNIAVDNNSASSASKPPDCLPRVILTQASATPNGSLAGTLEKPRLTNAHHQRSSSGISTSSVGMTIDNDDMQFEITNTNRGSKTMNKFINLSQGSLQRRQKRQSKQDEAAEEYTEAGSSQREKSVPPLHFVRGIWDGTLRKLRKSSRTKAFFISGKSDSQKLRKQLSRSLSDVSQPELPTVTAVIHQRSRSALASNEVYNMPNISVPTETSLTVAPKVQKVQAKKQKSTAQLRIDINECITDTSTSIGYSPKLTQSPTGSHHIRTSSQSKRVRLSSWSHGTCTCECDCETKDFIGSSYSNNAYDNNNYGTAVHSKNISSTDSKFTTVTANDISANESNSSTASTSTATTSVVSTEVINQHNYQIKTSSIPNYYKQNGYMSRVAEETSNAVMLPVKVRLPGGREQDLLLTKHDIYGQQYKSKRRQKPSDGVTVKRKRSMSQPNLYARSFIK